jgi:hypothetical protein
MLVQHGIPCTTVYDAILVARKYKKEANNILVHMIQQANLPTRFVPEEISRVKLDIQIESNGKVAETMKANYAMLANKISELIANKYRIGGLRKLVLGQVNEDIFLSGLFHRSLKRKNRSVVAANSTVSVDSAKKVALINEIVNGSKQEDQETAFGKAALEAVVFEKGKRQEENREKKQTISIPTGSQSSFLTLQNDLVFPLTL